MGKICSVFWDVGATSSPSGAPTPAAREHTLEGGCHNINPAVTVPPPLPPPPSPTPQQPEATFIGWNNTKKNPHDSAIRTNDSLILVLNSNTAQLNNMYNLRLQYCAFVPSAC